jgi:hypothetical protein
MLWQVCDLSRPSLDLHSSHCANNDGTNRGVVGINLGMTHSCVGVHHSGHIEIITNNQGNCITPSWVQFTNEEHLYILSFTAFELELTHFSLALETLPRLPFTMTEYNNTKEIEPITTLKEVKGKVKNTLLLLIPEDK